MKCIAAAAAVAYVCMNTGQKIMYDMRMQVFRHLQTLSPSFYDKNPVGRLITRVITDVDVLNELFSAGHRFDFRGHLHAHRDHDRDSDSGLASSGL